MLNRLKERLVEAGSDSLAFSLAVRLQAAIHGFRVRTSGGHISLVHGRREMILDGEDMISVPHMVHTWDEYFNTFEGDPKNGSTVLDFSQLGLHRYRKSGVSFYFPSIAEEDSMDAYTAAYSPQPGDVVWDVGAHAGSTAYFFAKMVGPAGSVYAFEPDDTSYEILLRNIDMHQLTNVTPVKAALSNTTGTATFCMNGRMSAGLSDFLPPNVSGSSKLVETLSLRDACDQFGSVPNYIKLDIEGAELPVVEGAIDFLREHPINLAIESNHLVGGSFTSGRLDKLLGDAGYRAWSSDEYGLWFTWAQPPR